MYIIEYEQTGAYDVCMHEHTSQQEIEIHWAVDVVYIPNSDALPRNIYGGTVLTTAFTQPLIIILSIFHTKNRHYKNTPGFNKTHAHKHTETHGMDGTDAQ